MTTYFEELRRLSANEFEYMHKEIKSLLDANTEEEYKEKVEYVYYKKPFNTENAIEKELIIFTKNNHIIQAKPVYNEDNRPYRIDISVLRVKDINRLDFNTNQSGLSVDKNLIIRFNDLNVIELKGNDINDNWKYDNSIQIQKIAKFLLKEI